VIPLFLLRGFLENKGKFCLIDKKSTLDLAPLRGKTANKNAFKPETSVSTPTCGLNASGKVCR
jgi:hypothetical protein